MYRPHKAGAFIVFLLFVAFLRPFTLIAQTLTPTTAPPACFKLDDLEDGNLTNAANGVWWSYRWTQTNNVPCLPWKAHVAPSSILLDGSTGSAGSAYSAKITGDWQDNGLSTPATYAGFVLATDLGSGYRDLTYLSQLDFDLKASNPCTLRVNLHNPDIAILPDPNLGGGGGNDNQYGYNIVVTSANTWQHLSIPRSAIQCQDWGTGSCPPPVTLPSPGNLTLDQALTNVTSIQWMTQGAPQTMAFWVDQVCLSAGNQGLPLPVPATPLPTNTPAPVTITASPTPTSTTTWTPTWSPGTPTSTRTFTASPTPSPTLTGTWATPTDTPTTPPGTPYCVPYDDFNDGLLSTVNGTVGGWYTYTWGIGATATAGSIVAGGESGTAMQYGGSGANPSAGWGITGNMGVTLDASSTFSGILFYARNTVAGPVTLRMQINSNAINAALEGPWGANFVVSSTNWIPITILKTDLGQLYTQAIPTSLDAALAQMMGIQCLSNGQAGSFSLQLDEICLLSHIQPQTATPTTAQTFTASPTPTPTWTGTWATPTATLTPGACFKLDDLEDGNLTNAANGVWWSYRWTQTNNVPCLPWKAHVAPSSILLDGSTGSAGSAYSAKITGDWQDNGLSTPATYAGFVLATDLGSGYRDLTYLSQLDFDLKASNPCTLRVNLHNPDIAILPDPNLGGGGGNDNQYGYNIVVTSANTWQHLSIPRSAIQCQDWGTGSCPPPVTLPSPGNLTLDQALTNVTSIQWMTQGAPQTMAFWVDQVCLSAGNQGLPLPVPATPLPTNTAMPVTTTASPTSTGTHTPTFTRTYTASPTPTPTRTGTWPTPTPGAYCLNIDDLEDGNDQIQLNCGRNGRWFSFSDKDANAWGQSSVFTGYGSSIGGAGQTFVASAGGANGSAFAARITGVVGPACGVPYNTCPIVGMGFTFLDPGSGPEIPYNLSAFTTINFSIRMLSTANTVRVMFPTVQTSAAPDGTCSGSVGACGDHWGVNLTGLTTAWTNKTIYLDQVVNGGDLSQEGWGTTIPFDRTQVLAMEWQFNNSQAGQNYDLSIDDVTFDGGATPASTSTPTWTATKTPTVTMTPVGTWFTSTPTTTGSYTFTPTFTITRTSTYTVTVTPTGTWATPTPGPYCRNIDDLEDGNDQIQLNCGRDGRWFTFTDKDVNAWGQSAVFTGSGSVAGGAGQAFVPSAGGANASAFAARITGVVGPTCNAPYNTCPFVGMGFLFLDPGAGARKPYDLSAFTSINFSIRMLSTATTVRALFPTLQTSAAPDGTCTGSSGACGDHWGVNLTGLTTAWTNKTIYLDQVVNGGDLSQEGWGAVAPFDRTQVLAMEWQFNNSQAGQAYDLSIDNVTFDGGTTLVSTPTSTWTATKSPTPTVTPVGTWFTSTPTTTGSFTFTPTLTFTRTPTPTPIFTPLGAGTVVVSPSAPSTLTLPNGATITLPAGSFASATTLTVQVFDSAAAPPAATYFSFGPWAFTIDAGGAALQGPVTVTFPYDLSAFPVGTTPADLRIDYFDGSSWVTMPTTVDTVAQTVTTMTTHFSWWAVIALNHSPTPTYTRTPTPVVSATSTPTASMTWTPTVSPTGTLGTPISTWPTGTYSPTRTPTFSPTQTVTATPMWTPTMSSSRPTPGVFSGATLLRVVSYPNPSMNGVATLYYEVGGGAVGSFDPTAKVALQIFTQSGLKIWETRLVGVKAGGNSYRWNGLDLKGAPLSNGFYFYQATVEGQGGQPSSKTSPLLILR